MQRIRKWLAVLVTASFVCGLLMPAVLAAETEPLVEASIVFTGTDDGEILYLRCGETVCGVSDALRITLLPENEEFPYIVDPAAVIVEQPAAENGNHLELFARLDSEWVVRDVSIQVDGLLLTADGEPHGCTISEEGTPDPAALQIYYPDPEISACINHYREQEGEDYIVYCVQGDVLSFDAKLDKLRDRLTAAWDGVQMRAVEDSVLTYTAVCGEGTLTLLVMQHIRYSTKVCVLTAKERRALLVRSAAANPKQRLSAWFEICFMVPTMAFFPISRALTPILLPLAALGAPLGDAIELLYMCITGKPLQMMR